MSNNCVYSWQVHELEGRLDQEIQSRVKAEEAARESLLKIESLGQSLASTPTDNETLSLHEEAKIDQQEQEVADHAEEKRQVPADVADTKANATVNIKPDKARDTSLEFSDDNKQVVSDVNAIPPTEQEMGGEQNVKESELQDVQVVDTPTVSTIVSSNSDSNCSASTGPNQKERRLSVETSDYNFNVF